MRNKAFKKRLIMVAPIVMLGVTIIMSIIGDLLINFKVYGELLKYLSDILGYSIFTNLIMLFYAYVHRYCIANRIALWTLLSLNLINILYNIIGLEYNVYWSLFNYVVMGVAMILITGYTYLAMNKKKELK